MASCQSGFSIKNIFGGMIAAALLSWALELSAGEQRHVVSNSRPPAGAAIDANRAPLPRSLQSEEPITSGTLFSWEDADKVENGMTEAEVIAILGQPYSRRASGHDAILIWSYTAGDVSNAVAYRFLNGRVISNHRIRR